MITNTYNPSLTGEWFLPMTIQNCVFTPLWIDVGIIQNARIDLSPWKFLNMWFCYRIFLLKESLGWWINECPRIRPL